MANIAPDHLLLGQRLPPVPLRPVVVIVVHHRAAAVVPKFCRRHRRSLQIPAEVFDAPPGTPGFLREVHLPVALILRLQVALPLFLIADMAEVGQFARIYAIVAGTQQTDNGTAPDGFNLLFFIEQIAPDTVFDIEATAGDGDMNVRMLIELASVGVQGAEDADLDAQLAHVPEYGAGGAAKKVVEQRPVVIEERPQQVRHGEGDVLPVAVGQDVLLFGDPLLGALEAAAAAGFRFAALAEKA